MAEPQRRRPPSVGFENLIVYEESGDLAARVLDASEIVERAGATKVADEMRRAADSISTNIAEGYGRGVNKSCLWFLRIARGSSVELERHLRACKRQRRLPAELVDSLIDQVIRVRYLIQRFAASVERRMK